MHLQFVFFVAGMTVAVWLFLTSPVRAVIEAKSGAEWVATSDEPGPNIPPVGRSLFDYLFTERAGGSAKYRVPFPFETLTEEIETYLRATTTRSLQKVLIPLGRSLQRNAASPHFFKSPRAVVAAEANPELVPGKPLIVLKDRFYLGYQPSAAAIEVISYNEAAGRFEFQIVEDYKLGAVPKVYYAERAICLGCHQNHAPIFAIQPWDESNSNPSVSSFLLREGDSFYGIPSFTGIDIPGLIGLSADRANLFTTYQLVWREGCAAGDRLQGINCRANALFAALRYRLAANTHTGTRQDEARVILNRQFRITWQEKWPTGLAIPSRELPDLDPFGGAKTYLGFTEAQVGSLEQRIPIDFISVDDAFEPLYPRGPLKVWDLPRRMPVSAGMEPSWLDDFISGLGEFFVPHDVEIFDQVLAAQGGDVMEHWAPCDITVIPDLLVDTMLSFACGASLNTATPLNIDARIQLDGGRFQDGVVENLRVDPYGPAGSLIATEGELHQTEERWRLVLNVRANNDGASIGELGRHPRINARLPAGDLISTVIFEWSRSGDTTPQHASVTVITLNDIGKLKGAVAALVTENVNGLSDVLLGGAFRRSALLAPLLESLGTAPTEWCCSDERKFPPIQVVGQ